MMQGSHVGRVGKETGASVLGLVLLLGIIGGLVVQDIR